jgi:hypothetical protein
MRYSIERLGATGASSLDRALGSASQRQVLQNNFQAFVASWTRVITPNLLNRFSFAENNFVNTTNPVTSQPQIDLPSLQEGASFHVPQETKQNRLQYWATLDWSHGKHNFKFGAEVQHEAADFYLGMVSAGTHRGRGELPRLRPQRRRRGQLRRSAVRGHAA